MNFVTMLAGRYITQTLRLDPTGWPHCLVTETELLGSRFLVATQSEVVTCPDSSLSCSWLGIVFRANADLEPPIILCTDIVDDQECDVIV